MPEPDFRQVIADQIAARAPKHTRRGWNAPVRLNDEHAEIVRTAAEHRGIAMASFVRRAVVAFACHELGLDYGKVMANEGPILGPTGHGEAEKDLGGRGHGEWEIVTLK